LDRLSQAFAGLIVPSLSSKRLVSRLNLLQTLCRTPARNDSYADVTCAPIMQPAPCGATHDKLTQRIRFVTECALLPRARPFVCHRQATVQNVPCGQPIRIFPGSLFDCPNKGIALACVVRIAAR